jgi:CYTH domain-containing protein
MLLRFFYTMVLNVTSHSVQVRNARDSKIQAVRTQQRELERRSGDVSLAVRFADELLTEGSEVRLYDTARYIINIFGVLQIMLF